MPVTSPRIPVTSAEQRAEETCLEPCPIERGMRLIGGKWKGSILWHLKDGPVRFNDLARRLGGATRKMVNTRLKEMEAQGMVRRRVLRTRPIAVTYEITEFRTSLHHPAMAPFADAGTRVVRDVP